MSTTMRALRGFIASRKSAKITSVTVSWKIFLSRKALMYSLNDFNSRHFLFGTYSIVTEPKSGQSENGQMAVNSGLAMLIQCSPGPCFWNGKLKSGAIFFNSPRIFFAFFSA